MTKNLKYFSLLTSIFSCIFFFFLNRDIRTEPDHFIWLYAFLFGSSIFISGLLLGYKESIRKIRFDLMFQYHLATYIIVNIIGIISFILSLGLNKSTLFIALAQALPWGVGLVIHYYFSLRSIKGIQKKNLFE